MQYQTTSTERHRAKVVTDEWLLSLVLYRGDG
jgi:hypothetical protein